MPVRPSKTALSNATIATSVSPAQITADQNDYTPTGFGTADEVRLDTDASRTVTGFAAPTGTEQTRKTIINVGSNDLVLAHENAGSTAANRLVTADASNLTLTAGQAANIAYDATTTRWRVLTSPGGGGSSLTAPVNPTDDGKVAVASGGDLSYALLANANVDAAAAITVSKLGAGTEGQVVQTVGGVPTWSDIPGGATADTDWVAYTPDVYLDATLQTLTSTEAFWRRVGDSIELHVSFVWGTSSGTGTVGISLPSGVPAPDHTKLSTEYIFTDGREEALLWGNGSLRDISAGTSGRYTKMYPVLPMNSTGHNANLVDKVVIWDGFSAVQSYVTNASPTTLGSGDIFNVRCLIPITGWTATGGGQTVDTDWVSYTPDWTATTTSPVLGDGSLVGSWRREGDSVRVRVFLEIGSTTTTGSGTWLFSLPTGLTGSSAKFDQLDLSGSNANPVVGAALLSDNNASKYAAFARISADLTKVYANIHGQTAALSSTVPFTWGSGDECHIEFLVPIEGWIADGSSGVAESTISPTALSANTNDYEPTNWHTSTIVRLSTDGSDYDITGFAAPTGTAIRKTLINVDSTNTITLKNEDANSTAANRIITSPGTGFAMLPGDAVELLYDEVSLRWRTV